jgi:predicted permease
MSHSTIAPPRILRRMLRAALPTLDRDSLLEELDTRFHMKATRSRMLANFWYARESLALLMHVGMEQVHDGFGGLSGIRSDARLALRSFHRHPGFAVSFIVTLAIGTGVLATVYTAAQWVLLRPVPGVTRSEQLMTIRLGSTEAPPHVSWAISHPDYLTFRDRLPFGGQLAATTPVELDLQQERGEPFRVDGALVSQNYFSVLGVRPSEGRGFLAEEEDRAGGEHVAVISEALARRLNSSGSAVGRRIRINGNSVLVVGVASRGFHGASLPGTEEVWLPLSADRIVDPSASPGIAKSRDVAFWSQLIGRAAPGLTIGAVRASANGVMENIRSEFTAHSFSAMHFRMQIFPGIGLDPAVRASVRQTLTQLGIVAVLLLCLATANLANLSLIESTRRATASAVRVALGASRARVASAALIETLLLGIAGTAAALWLAYIWSGWYQATQLSEHGGALTGMRLDPRVAGVTMLVALVAAGAAFLRPASMLRRPTVDHLIRRGAEDVRASHRLRAGLISVQVALSLVLLVAAGLLGRTVLNLRNIELGFEPSRVLTFSLAPHLHGFEGRTLDNLARRLESRLAQDGALTAGFISPSPFRSSYLTAALYGSDDPEVRPLIGAGFFVSPGLIPALGVPTLAGDSLWQADSGTTVISRAAAKALFPGLAVGDVVGRIVPTRPKRGRPVRIAAVIEDVRLSDVTDDPVPVIFFPLMQRYASMSLTGVVDTKGMSGSDEVVRRIIGLDAPEIPLFNVRSARAAIDLQFADRNAMARASGTLAVIGLLLSAVGLYAVISAVVATRRREIGIRGALGAAPHRILRRMLATGLLPVLIGLPLGLAGSMLVGKLLAPQLFGLERIDPLSYVIAIGVLLCAATVAALLPSWRATRISLADVLREE